MDVELADDGSSFLLRLFLASSAAKADGLPYDFKSESVARFVLDSGVEAAEAGLDPESAESAPGDSSP